MSIILIKSKLPAQEVLDVLPSCLMRESDATILSDAAYQGDMPTEKEITEKEKDNENE